MAKQTQRQHVRASGATGAPESLPETELKTTSSAHASPLGALAALTRSSSANVATPRASCGPRSEVSRSAWQLGMQARRTRTCSSSAVGSTNTAPFGSTATVTAAGCRESG